MPETGVSAGGEWEMPAAGARSLYVGRDWTSADRSRSRGCSGVASGLSSFGGVLGEKMARLRGGSSSAARRARSRAEDCSGPFLVMML